MTRFSTLLLILWGCLFYKCKNDKFSKPIRPEDPAPVVAKNCGTLANVSFSAQVQPIINSNCISCHDASTGFKLCDYSHVALFANSGQLTGCLTGDPGYLQMPPGASIDSCALKTIVRWVQQGKLDN